MSWCRWKWFIRYRMFYNYKLLCLWYKTPFTVPNRTVVLCSLDVAFQNILHSRMTFCSILLNNQASTLTNKNFIYLFLAALGLRCWAHALVPESWDYSLSCSVKASVCGGLSCCKAQALGLAGRLQESLQCGLSSWGSWALEHRLSSCGPQA